MTEKAYIALNRVLVETWLLRTLVDSERRQEQGRENFYHCRERSYHCERIVGRNMDTKGAAGRAQKEMRKVLATGGKGTLVLSWQRA